MIETIEQLEAIYGHPGDTSLVKVADRLTPEYLAYIQASPFCALATVGPEGLDCTPRGDEGTVVFVEDAKTLALPDRRGNNRIDSLRNIVRDPRVSLMFLIPGSNTVIRVNGTAKLSDDVDMLKKYAKQGKAPRTVILITINELYFQCARAPMRAGLWNGKPAPDLPKPGQILASMSDNKIGGKEYDEAWLERALNSMW